SKGNEVVSFPSRLDQRQRPARWPGDRPARGAVKVSVMTGAKELLLLVRDGDDTARQMRAALIVGNEAGLVLFIKSLLPLLPHQQTGIILPREVELQHFAGLEVLDLLQRGDFLWVRFGSAAAEPVADADANLTDDEGETGQHHELGEF